MLVADLDQLRLLDLLRRIRVDVVAVAIGLRPFGADRLLRLAGELVDLLGREHAALRQDLLLLGRERRTLRRDAALEALGFAARELDDLLADAHRAPVVPAHRAE